MSEASSGGVGQADLFAEEVVARAGLEGEARDFYLPRLRDEFAAGAQIDAKVAAAGAGARLKPLLVFLQVVLGAVCLYYVLYTLISPHVRSHFVLLKWAIGVFCLLKAHGWLRQRVWVSDCCLYVYPAFSRMVKVPFREIVSVSVRRGLLIETSGGETVKISSKYRDFLYAATALLVRSRHVMTEDACKYLIENRASSAPMKPWIKVLISALLAGFFVLLFLSTRLMWEQHSISVAIPLALNVGVFYVLAFCGFMIKDRSKSALFFALALLSLVTLWNITMVNREEADYRPYVVWLWGGGIASLLFLWGRVQHSGRYLAGGMAAIAAVFLAGHIMPSGKYGERTVLGKVPEMISHLAIIPGSEAAGSYSIMAFGEVQSTDGPDQLVVATINNGATKLVNVPVDLHNGTQSRGLRSLWGIYARHSDGVVLSVMDTCSLDDGAAAYSTTFFDINKGGDISSIADLENCCGMSTADAISPDGRFLIAYSLRTDKGPAAAFVVDRDDGTTRSFDDFPQMWKWLDNSTIVALDAEGDGNHRNATGKVMEWRLNVETGETTGTPWFDLGEGFAFSGIGASDYNVVVSDWATLIVDMYEGTSISLPAMAQRDFATFEAFDWNAGNDHLAYLIEESDHRVIVLANPEGIVATKRLDDDFELASIMIAPDASRVLLFGKIGGTIFFDSNTLQVWDIEDDSLRLVATEPFFAYGFRSMPFLSRPYHWLPDSGGIIWVSRKWSERELHFESEVQLIRFDGA